VKRRTAGSTWISRTRAVVVDSHPQWRDFPHLRGESRSPVEGTDPALIGPLSHVTDESRQWPIIVRQLRPCRRDRELRPNGLRRYRRSRHLVHDLMGQEPGDDKEHHNHDAAVLALHRPAIPAGVLTAESGRAREGPATAWMERCTHSTPTIEV